PGPCFRSPVNDAASVSTSDLLSADRSTLAHRYRDLQPTAVRTCYPGRRGQRTAWRFRLDADSLPQQGIFTSHTCWLLPYRQRGPGNALTRWDEPRREGVCGGPRSVR